MHLGRKERRWVVYEQAYALRSQIQKERKGKKKKWETGGTATPARILAPVERVSMGNERRFRTSTLSGLLARLAMRHGLTQSLAEFSGNVLSLALLLLRERSGWGRAAETPCGPRV